MGKITISSSRFTVDTHLFRELGELLVGRDSTALVELLKNSYDADATRVRVHAENLEDLKTGYIQITDDGIGMTRKRFEEGFLRIASRVKEEGSRLSTRFNRRYTGAKGIGRLAAHKLASLLEVQSIATHPVDGRFIDAFRATIDWNLIEKAKTLDRISPNAVRIERFKPQGEFQGGTVLILKKLRRPWHKEGIIQFVQEARATLAPAFLRNNISGRLIEEPLLFDVVREYSSPSKATDWSLELSGDFDIGDDFLSSVAEAASWVLEVNASKAKIEFGVCPTKNYAKVLIESKREKRSLDRIYQEGQPCFQARILIREGDWDRGAAAVKHWRKVASGVMVYLEGFRVLPYGERGNDWLDIDKTYGRRIADPLTKGLFDEDENTARKGFSYLPTRGYLGAVFLTLDQAGGLKMLVNREGFLPDGSFVDIQIILGRAIDFATRVRSAAKELQKAQWRSVRTTHAQVSARTPLQELEISLRSGIQEIRSTRVLLARGEMSEAKGKMDELEGLFATLSIASEEVRDQQAIIYSLASLGAQMAAFVHEIHGLVGLAQAVERSLQSILDSGWGERQERRAISLTLKAANELRQSLDRQASYLTHVVTVDSRRRRSAQSLSAAFNSALDLVRHAADRMNIKIESQIPPTFKSPPMFKSELVAVFSNLLSNAIKAAGARGRIRAEGQIKANGDVAVHLANSGVAVSIPEGEKWFMPFASSSDKADPSLGEGMGLGLTITRRLLSEYGAEIYFVHPLEGFSTAIEVKFPRV